jgi:protein TonB
MVNRIAFRPVMPMTASALFHVGVVAALVLGQDWAPATMPVLIAELVEAEAPPVARPPAPPVLPDRRPITPPRPIAAPLPPEPPPPREPEPLGRLPEPPAVVAPEPPKPVAPQPMLLTPEPAVVPRPVPESPRPVLSDPPPPAPPSTTGSPAAVARPVASATADPGPDTFAASAPALASPAASRAPAGADGPAVAAVPADGVTRRAIPRGGYQYRPAYPSRARRLGIQGTTLLHVLVSERGRVAEVVVKQSAGHPDLDQAAADAVRRWQFEPARSGDQSVQMWVQLPFEFRLR